MLACVQMPVMEYLERLPTAYDYLNRFYYFPCFCIGLCPSNATKGPLISPLEASVERPYLHLHSPLLASKSGLSSWSFGGDMFFNHQGHVPAVEKLVPPGTTHYIRKHSVYVQEYMVCRGTRSSPVGYALIYECVRTLCDQRVTNLGGYM